MKTLTEMSVEELKLKIKNQKESNATIQRKFNEATATIKTKNSEILKLKSEIKSHGEESTSKDEIIKNLQAQMNVETRKLDDMVKLHEDGKQTLIHQNFQIKCQQQKFEIDATRNLHEMAKFHEGRLKSKDQIINNFQAQINMDNRKMHEMMKISEDRKKALLHEQSQVQCLKQQLEKDGQKQSGVEEELKKEINELKDSYSLLQEHVRNKELQLANEIRKLEEKDKLIIFITDEIKDLRKTHDSLTSFAELRKQLDDEDAKRNMKEIMRTNEDQKNSLARQESQIQRLEKQKIELEKDISKHTELEDELKKEINEMKDSYVLLQEQMRDRELEDTNVITDLKAKLEVKRQEKIDFVMKQMKSESKSRQVLSLINHQLNDFNGKFDSQTAELKEINCKFDKQTTEIHELCKQIEELKMENQTLAGLYRSEKKVASKFR
ncbi:Oidioi.mRNA.OKI2018_I69.chr2.g7942.t1.cds [Oikopleura dioica]|uniref:Oidioi.mRNA.OKI2018_I69.chr2.g7942.t1.cds n=1 Tax=Oikopleura dioica TaxID=34765 RepID=A0ABN7TB37_OIKDI|nr:Oidioi.mRNA.OKI2018_I69.chr2.g7942.t1.cds [Oikopleura dioica]